jgi:hypothetical protein
MKSKQAAKRPKQSQGFTERARSLLRAQLPDLLEFLRWDKELDPTAVAMVALHLDGEACRAEKRHAVQDPRRKALVEAALFLREAQDIVTNGPSLEDLPLDLAFRFLEEQSNNNRWAKAWTAAAKLSTPGERFRARAKIITLQDRAERAEADLREYLKDQRKKPTSPTPFLKDWKGQFTEEALEAKEAPVSMAFGHVFLFITWKQNHKSEAAKQSRKTSLKEGNFGKKLVPT